jgi:hypothetical protein
MGFQAVSVRDCGIIRIKWYELPISEHHWASEREEKVSRITHLPAGQVNQQLSFDDSENQPSDRGMVRKKERLKEQTQGKITMDCYPRCKIPGGGG